MGLICLCLISSGVHAAEPLDFERNLICIGADLSPSPRPKAEIYIHIGNYKPIPYYETIGKVGLTNIDPNQRHLVKLVHEGKALASWWLDLRKLKTNRIMIWKAYGAWKMEPMTKSECEQKF